MPHMFRRRAARTVAAAALIVAVSGLRAAGPAAPADLNAWVARAMQTFEVPGVSLAIVKDGALVSAKACLSRPVAAIR